MGSIYLTKTSFANAYVIEVTLLFLNCMLTAKRVIKYIIFKVCRKGRLKGWMQPRTPAKLKLKSEFCIQCIYNDKKFFPKKGFITWHSKQKRQRLNLCVSY